MLTLSLQPQAVARALDVGLDTLDHWVQEGWLETAARDRAEEGLELAQVLRFIRRHHLTIHQPDALGLRPGPWGSRTRANEVHCLLDAIASPNADELCHLLLGRFATSSDLPAYIDGPLNEALGHCRAALAQESGPAAQAQNALHVAADAMRQAAALVSAQAADAPAAIASALDDDRDPTPAAQAALLLADHGHRLIGPGPVAAPHNILRAADEHRPALIVVTLSAPVRPATVAAEQLADLTHRLGAYGSRVLSLGPRKDLSAAHTPHLTTCRELAQWSAPVAAAHRN